MLSQNKWITEGVNLVDVNILIVAPWFSHGCVYSTVFIVFSFLVVK
jgi:hypothetical protein